MMHDWWSGWGPGGASGMWLGPFFMLLPLAALIVVVVIVARLLGRSGTPPESASSAKAVLDERFARGEIDQDEYEKRRAALEK